MERFDVRTSRTDPPAQALSGGNLQKFVVGRELDREPAVLVVNQPTWGVDAGAAALVRQVLADMAEAGAAVLVISQDLDEIFEIADRIAVISRGELSEAFPAGEIDRERIGLLMAGAHEIAAPGIYSHEAGTHGTAAQDSAAPSLAVPKTRGRDSGVPGTARFARASGSRASSTRGRDPAVPEAAGQDPGAPETTGRTRARFRPVRARRRAAAPGPAEPVPGSRRHEAADRGPAAAEPGDDRALTGHRHRAHGVRGGVIFAARGLDPLHALYVYFVEPVTTMWSIEELVVKAAPLVLIGAGLAVCFRANLWNIGAEGQFTAGAIAGGAIPVMAPDLVPWLALPLMLVLGMLGGMAWAAVPALLRNRLGANEILTSLMLVYVAQLLLDWLVRGPWRDPHGYNFPKTVAFQDWQLLPTLGFGRVHLGALFAVIAVVVLFVLMSRTLKGFEVRVSGDAPRAGGFGGFSRPHMVWFCFGVAGALAGLAGICEAAGPIGQLQPHISPGYGFTAIIVAFLGRLNPIGVLLAGIVLAISYLGGEAAQVELGISDKTATVFQGVLLFFILACDTLIRYRIRWAGPRAAAGRG